MVLRCKALSHEPRDLALKGLAVEKKNVSNSKGKKASNKKTNQMVNFIMIIHSYSYVSGVQFFVKQIDGVESVKCNRNSIRLEVKGRVDPFKIREMVELETRQKVELIFPLDEMEADRDENRNIEAKLKKQKSSHGNEIANEKTKEGLLVMKIQLCCESCNQKLQKVLKNKGLETVTMDVEKNLVTVKGMVDMTELRSYVKNELKKDIEILAPAEVMIPVKKDEAANDVVKKNAGVMNKKGKDTGAADKAVRGDTTVDEKYKGNATVDDKYRGTAVVEKKFKGNATETVDAKCIGTPIVDQKYKGKATVDDKYRGTSIVDQKYEGKATVDDKYRGTAIVDQKYEGKATVDDKYRGTAIVDQKYKGINKVSAEYKSTNKVDEKFKGTARVNEKYEVTTTVYKKDKGRAALDEQDKAVAAINEKGKGNATKDKKDKYKDKDSQINNEKGRDSDVEVRYKASDGGGGKRGKDRDGIGNKEENLGVTIKLNPMMYHTYNDNAYSHWHEWPPVKYSNGLHLLFSDDNPHSCSVM